jgi:hypothetical protein
VSRVLRRQPLRRAMSAMLWSCIAGPTSWTTEFNARWSASSASGSLTAIASSSPTSRRSSIASATAYATSDYA